MRPNNAFRKGDSVVWVTPDGKRFPGGIITKLNLHECYVLFDGGGHWRAYSELEHEDKSANGAPLSS